MGRILGERASADVFRVTIDAPPSNALSISLLEELASVVRRAPADARALALRGAGSCFSIGLVGDAARGADALRRALAALEDVALPTFALVDGPALGAGAALVRACDLAVATELAVLGPERAVGAFVANLGAREAAVAGLVQEIVPSARDLEGALARRLEAFGPAAPPLPGLIARRIRRAQSAPRAYAGPAPVGWFGP